jgi:putative hydrolase of the HAD superfamily
MAATCPLALSLPLEAPVPSRDRGHRVESILCDVGDVLIHWDTAVPAAIEGAYSLPMGSVLAHTLKSDAGRLATVGAIDTAEWFRRVSATLPEKAIKEWLDYHGELNQELVDALSSIRRHGTRLCLLSNASSRLRQDLAYHGIRDIADYVLCSADIRRVIHAVA